MDLNGKFVDIWLLDEAAKLFLGISVEATKKLPARWRARGFVVDPDDTHGVWMDVDAFEQLELEPDGKLIVDWGPLKPRTALIRWEWIISVRVLGTEKPAEIGIRPRREPDQG